MTLKGKLKIKKMQVTRQQRIEKLIQKELGEIFLLYAREIPGTIIGVTNVRISPDLSIARIHISIYPTNKSGEIFESINHENKSVRFELGKRVRNQLRIIPELHFYLDDSLDYAEHIDQLLKGNIPPKQ